MQEKIIILDFGSQTTQLIGRRVRAFMANVLLKKLILTFVISSGSIC